MGDRKVTFNNLENLHCVFNAILLSSFKIQANPVEQKALFE